MPTRCYFEPFTRFDDAVQLFARGRIQVDVRTATAYGLLRTFVRFEMSRTGDNDTSSNLAQGFIQFGGLTAGQVTSFFSNADLPTQHFGTLRFDDAPDINLFAYTFQFGGGVSATLAVEEGQARRNNGIVVAGGGIPGGTVFEDPVTGAFLFQQPFGLVYGGQTVPDIVANIRSAGTWGSVQLSGAVHQIRDVGIPGGTCLRLSSIRSPALPVVLPAFADTEYGWAVGLSGHLAMPWLGQGDAIWAFGTYSSGAASYSGFAGDIRFGGSGDVGAPATCSAPVWSTQRSTRSPAISTRPTSGTSRAASRTTGRRSSARTSSVRSRGSSIGGNASFVSPFTFVNGRRYRDAGGRQHGLRRLQRVAYRREHHLVAGVRPEPRRRSDLCRGGLQGTRRPAEGQRDRTTVGVWRATSARSKAASACSATSNRLQPIGREAPVETPGLFL